MSTAPASLSDPLSLQPPADVLELRRDLVRRSATLRVRARSLRSRGSLRAAWRCEEHAHRLVALSRRMA